MGAAVTLHEERQMLRLGLARVVYITWSKAHNLTAGLRVNKHAPHC